MLHILCSALVICTLLLVLPAEAANEGKIAFSSDRPGNWDIYTMDANGTRQLRLTSSPADDTDPSWSPDGSRIAFTSGRDGTREIYLMNANGTGQMRLTAGGGWNYQPAWSPDGSKIAFVSNRSCNWEVYSMNTDGSGQTRLTNNAAVDNNPAWSPDGSQISFDSNRYGSFDVHVMNADGTGQSRLITGGSTLSAWSPTGEQIAFESGREGSFQVYVVNRNGTGLTRLTSAGSLNGLPAWSPDSTKILFTSYRDGNGEIYAMNADGSGQTRLTTAGSVDTSPAWAPLLTVHAPDGGERWPRGSVQTLRWNFTGNPGPRVRIQLVQGTTVKRVINASAPAGSGGSGSYRWEIPWNQVTGSGYRIRVTSTARPTYTDTGNANFTITAGPPLTVMVPNGRETWNAGSTRTIQWKYTGNYDPFISIDLLRGSAVETIVSANTAVGSGGTGSFLWTIPVDQSPGTDYRIRITSLLNANRTDRSNANFTITA